MRVQTAKCSVCGGLFNNTELSPRADKDAVVCDDCISSLGWFRENVIRGMGAVLEEPQLSIKDKTDVKFVLVTNAVGAWSSKTVTRLEDGMKAMEAYIRDSKDMKFALELKRKERSDGV